jgi:hypothetical protein
MFNYNSFSDFNSVSELFKNQHDPKTGYKATPLALQQPKISDTVF